MAGRPSKYTPEIGQQFADLIAEGKTMPKVAEELGVPMRTLYEWNANNEEFSQLFARARDVACDAFSYQVVDIADDPSIDPAHKRIMVDARVKIIGKWSNRYSEKHSVDHTTKGEKLHGPGLTDEQLMAIAKGIK